MRAFIILMLLLNSAAYAQSECRSYEQELERARTLYYPSRDAAAAEVSSLTKLQNACDAELVQANPVCRWVRDQTVHILESDRKITIAAACVRALEIDRKAHARTEGVASRSIKQP